MFCKNCGTQIDDNAVVCPSCGVAVNEVSSVPEGTQRKSKVAAGILGILLGSLGIHNFYLGYTKKAVAQLLITILGSFIIIGPLVAEIWGLIEGIQILTGKISCDANGVPLSE